MGCVTVVWRSSHLIAELGQRVLFWSADYQVNDCTAYSQNEE